MAAITIVSVNYESTPYLEPLLANLRAKAADPSALSILIVDNTNGRDAEIARAVTPLERARLVPFDTGPVKGSRAHAKGLDFALRQVETEFAVIVDPDIYVFKTGWDRLCVTELEKHGAGAIGAPYPAWKVGKYHDFPSPPFCFLRTAAFRALDVGFIPFGNSRVEDATAFVTRQVGRLGNLLTRRSYEKRPWVRSYATWAERYLGVFAPDTGWRVAEAARRRGMTSLLFEPVLAAPELEQAATGAETERAALACLTREFELYTYQGERMMTHKYGSGALPWRTGRASDVDFWRDCIRTLEATSSVDRTP